MPVLVVENGENSVIIMRSLTEPDTMVIMYVDSHGDPLCEAIYIPFRAIKSFLEVLIATR